MVALSSVVEAFSIVKEGLDYFQSFSLKGRVIFTRSKLLQVDNQNVNMTLQWTGFICYETHLLFYVTLTLRKCITL